MLPVISYGGRYSRNYFQKRLIKAQKKIIINAVELRRCNNGKTPKEAGGLSIGNKKETGSHETGKNQCYHSCV